MKFKDDISLLNSLSSSVSFLLVTSKLYKSAYFLSLRSLFDQYDIQYDILNSSSYQCDGPIAILGLENEWSADLALDRTYVNLLREVPDLNIILTYVVQRDGLVSTFCESSLIPKQHVDCSCYWSGWIYWFAPCPKPRFKWF